MGDEHNSGALSIGFKSLVHFDALEFPNNKFDHALISTQNVNSICNLSQPWKRSTRSISTISAAKLLAAPLIFILRIYNLVTRRTASCIRNQKNYLKLAGENTPIQSVTAAPLGFWNVTVT